MPGQAGEPEPAQQRGTTPRQRQPKIRMRAANAFTGTDPSRPKGYLLGADDSDVPLLPLWGPVGPSGKSNFGNRPFPCLLVR